MPQKTCSELSEVAEAKIAVINEVLGRRNLQPPSNRSHPGQSGMTIHLFSLDQIRTGVAGSFLPVGPHSPMSLIQLDGTPE